MTKIILITGTSKGIGRFLAETYLERGFKVIGCSRRTSKLEHNNYEHYHVDVSDEISVKKMVSSVYKMHKRIDYLINNAGFASMNMSVLTPFETVENIFKTNFYGTFLFCREVTRVMLRNKFGRIVNFTTMAVPLNLMGESIYASSKSAIEMFSHILAREISSSGITCNTVGPSVTWTDMIKNVPKDKIDKVLNAQGIHEYATFDDILNVVDFFLSDNSNMITGQVVYLGGC